MGESKTYSTVLVLDWKTGKFRVLSPKAKSKSFKASEIPIDFSLKVNVPSPLKVKAHAEVTLSEQKISEIVAEEI